MSTCRAALRRSGKFTPLPVIVRGVNRAHRCPMNLSGKHALVTGANRGLGRELVSALLDRGVAQVYAAARDPRSVGHDARVVPLPLDLREPESPARLAAAAPDVDLLINNAGTAAFASALDAAPDAVAGEMAVNYTGLLAMIRAFSPILTRRQGAMVNVLTLLSYAPAPPMAGYSASKAAAHSLTLSLRPALAREGVTLHAVYPGGIDTDMLAGVDAPKADPRAVASAILDGVEAGTEDIYPDPTSAQMSELYARDPRAFAAAFAALGS
jgi:NAD(P)-dependent dehydrogenase (short-subunit alcohol dehydrogenase family)